MGECGRALARLAGSWKRDTLLSVLTMGWTLGYQQVNAVPWAERGQAIGFGLAFATALTIRRKYPVPATVACGIVLLAVRAAGLGHAAEASLEFFGWMPFFLAYSAGAEVSKLMGLAAVTWLAAALLVQNRWFNPFLIRITAGPWLAGRMVRSRRELIRQLEARNRELEAEREQFARDSVRYERARIARELHDIVAHSLSLIVVQAGAGQRLVDVDQGAAAEALRAIAQAAGSAQAEVAKLADLLGEAHAGTSQGLASVDELVCQASAAGLHVTSRTLASGDVLAPAASRAAYRVIQQALTNALPHAPGTQVEITVTEHGGCVAISVHNGPPLDGSPGPDWPGAGRGLAGLKDRVAACGGSLTAGPTPSGGWLVQAQLPAVIA